MTTPNPVILTLSDSEGEEAHTTQSRHSEDASASEEAHTPQPCHSEGASALEESRL